MRLRSHLIALVLATLVPVLGFAAFVIRENGRLQLSATELGMRETAHAVAQTVDKELQTAITSLEALGESEHLDDPVNLQAFHRLCRRVARSQGWLNILVFDAQGRGLLHTSKPVGEPLGPSIAQDTIARARDERRAVVSNLFDGSEDRNIVAVYVPVARKTSVRFVLSAGLPAARFAEVLRAQHFGGEAVAVLQDRANVIVARTQGAPGMVGQRVPNPSPGEQGWLRSRLQDGTDVYVAFATGPLSGWRVVLTSPVSAIQGQLQRGAWQMLTGAAMAAALAAGLAFVFGRKIARAVGSLVGIAHAVERGDRAEPLHTGVAEVNVVAEQLRIATDLAQARQEDAAVAARQARTIAEVAHALNASPDLDTVLRTAVEAVRGLVHADGARIAIVDDAGRLVLRHSTGPSTAMPPGFVIERGHGLGGVVWSTGHPVRSDDIARDERFKGDRYLPIVLADGIVSSMAVPIVTRTEVVGVIYANRMTRRPFTKSDEDELVTLADHAAVAVQKANLLAREHAARADAEAAVRGKDEMLAMLGHELRNPLSAIASAVRVLDTPTASAAVAKRAREIIGRQNAHLAHLVDDLLDVARVTSGKIALTRRPLDLAEAVHRAVSTLAASGRTQSHQLTVDADTVWADVDETRFEQIVTNLVGNALKFTPAGGTVDVGLTRSGDEAVLTVRDSGVGMTPHMVPRIFDLFVQGERGPERGAGGLGLGLTLVRCIAELHGGSVAAASGGPGRGSQFTVRLPTIQAPPLTPLTPPPSTVPQPFAGRRRILVVEDNTDARDMLRQALELSGHEVHEASDGPAGIDAALRLRPDVALIDVGLPGLNGYEVARHVRAAPGTSIALIALTGYGQPDDRRQALDAGFDLHLVKPIEADKLLAAIHAAAPRTAPGA